MKNALRIIWLVLFLLVGVGFFFYTEVMVDLLFKGVGLFLGIAVIAVLSKDVTNKLINIFKRD